MKTHLHHFLLFIAVTGLWGAYLFFSNWLHVQAFSLLDLDQLAHFFSGILSEDINTAVVYDWIPVAIHFLCGSFLIAISWRAAVSLQKEHAIATRLAQVKTPQIRQLPAKSFVPIKNWDSEIQSLHKLGEYLKSAPTEGEVFSRLKDVLSKLFPSANGSLCLFDRGHNRIRTVVTWGKLSIVRDTFHPEECLPLEQGQEFCREIKARDQVSIFLRDGLEGLLLSLPISNHGDFVGVFSLLLPEGIASFGGSPKEGIENLRKIAGIASQTIGFYFTNLNFQEKLEIHSIRDPLTGIFNKRYMEETLQREFAAAQRKQFPIGVVMVQVDQFKAVLQKYGERALETILWEIGSRMPNYIRSEDIPCRFSKKAFAIILPGADLSITEARAEKIRYEAASLNVLYKSKLLEISLSVGVASLPHHVDNCSDLIRLAEKSLFDAFNAGGNQVVIAGQKQSQTVAR